MVQNVLNNVRMIINHIEIITIMMILYFIAVKTVTSEQNIVQVIILIMIINTN